MPRPALEVRPDLAGVAPYLSPQLVAAHRMNTNESPYPPPPALVAELLMELGSVALNRYPDRDATGLFEALAAHAEWSPEGLWIANGSNEVLMHLFLAFGGPGRTVLVFEPTYALHTLIPKIAGTGVMNATRAESWRIDLDTAAGIVAERRPEIVMLCSPNNPSGGTEPLDTVRALLEEAPGIVVVDEAYAEFAPRDDSVRALLSEHSNLIIVKSFSKAWSLAGARIGYLLGDPLLIRALARVRLPYHLSALTQAAGLVALRHSEAILSSVERIVAERERISVELQAMGVKTFPSRANFVLFQIDDAPGVWEGLLSKGVLVRNYSDHEGMRNCLRVTAGLPEETTAFLRAMSEVLDD